MSILFTLILILATLSHVNDSRPLLAAPSQPATPVPTPHPVMYDPKRDVANWSAFHNDFSRSGVNQQEDVLNSDNVKQLQDVWDYHTGGTILASPAIVNGIIYFGSFDGFFYALRPRTNQLVWRTRIGALIGSSPAVINGVIYFGAGSYVLALRQSDGKILWRYRTGPELSRFVWSSPLVVKNTVFVGSSSADDNPLLAGYLHAINARTGELLWEFRTVPQIGTGGGIWGSAAFDPDSNSVFFGSGNPDDSVYSLDADTGLVKWQFKAVANDISDYDFGAAPVLFKDAAGHLTLAIGSKDGNLYCLNGETGELLWKFQAAYASGDVGVRSTPAYDRGVLYFGSNNLTSNDNGVVYAVDAATGKQIWSTPTAFPITSSPALANGIIYIGSGSEDIKAIELGQVLALRESDGQVLWTYKPHGSILSSPAVVNGVLYIGSLDYTVYAFSLPSFFPARH